MIFFFVFYSGGRGGNETLIDYFILIYFNLVAELELISVY